MKKLFQKYGSFLAALAIVVTTMNANSTCLCIHCCNNNECKFNMPLHYASGLIAGRS